MARKPSGNPTGRPETPLDWEQFEKLCSLHCTQSEIASFLKVHVDTLRDRAEKHYGEPFSITYKKFLEQGKCSLRRDQRVLAKNNAAMAIWLGKQYLGQKDTQQEEFNSTSLEHFNALMSQLLSLQERKREEMSNKADNKSAWVTGANIA